LTPNGAPENTALSDLNGDFELELRMTQDVEVIAPKLVHTPTIQPPLVLFIALPISNQYMGFSYPKSPPRHPLSQLALDREVAQLQLICQQTTRRGLRLALAQRVAQQRTAAPLLRSWRHWYKERVRAAASETRRSGGSSAGSPIAAVLAAASRSGGRAAR